MKVHYPKLYNMAHRFSLNVLIASKGSNNYTLLSIRFYGKDNKVVLKCQLIAKGPMFIRTRFHINRLTLNYFRAFLHLFSDRPSYYGIKLEEKKRGCTLRVATTKALVSCAVICFRISMMLVFLLCSGSYIHVAL